MILWRWLVKQLHLISASGLFSLLFNTVIVQSTFTILSPHITGKYLTNFNVVLDSQGEYMDLVVDSSTPVTVIINNLWLRYQHIKQKCARTLHPIISIIPIIPIVCNARHKLLSFWRKIVAHLKAIQIQSSIVYLVFVMDRKYAVQKVIEIFPRSTWWSRQRRANDAWSHRLNSQGCSNNIVLQTHRSV